MLSRIACLGFVLFVAEDFSSGPQVGQKVPGQFLAVPLNGPDAGEECCLYCRYGNAPVVMVFAPKASPELAKLVHELEVASVKADDECGVCVIVTNASPAAKKELGKMAGDARLKRVVLAVVDPARVKDYELNAEAGATVVLYSNRVVRSNYSFRPGQLDDTAVENLGKAVRKHWAK